MYVHSTYTQDRIIILKKMLYSDSFVIIATEGTQVRIVLMVTIFKTFYNLNYYFFLRNRDIVISYQKTACVAFHFIW